MKSLHTLKPTLRPAIAMIELIFALVIMGITLMSAPMLISQATKSSFVAFQQESIAVTASHTNALLTYAWDEQNTQAIANRNAILTVSVNAEDLLDPGVRAVPGRRGFNVADPNATASTTLGADVSTPNENDDDVDDFIDVNQTLTLATLAPGAVDTGDYIDQNVSLQTSVNYMNDSANYDSPTGDVVFDTPAAFVTFTSNIKYISVTLTSTSASSELNDKQITFNAFMCNIGGALPDSSKNMNTGELQNAPLGRF